MTVDLTAAVGRDGAAMRSELLDRLEACLWPQGFARDVWMIVDAARNPRIVGLLLDSFYSRHSCLFSGTLPPALKLAAPYLLQLEYRDERTRRFISRAWGESWGVFLRCDAPLETLRRHLRGLLVVRNRRDTHLMFRYYDPRVLRVYLPTCTHDELRTVFGPVDQFWLEDETPDTIREFHLEAGRLIRLARSLDRAEPE